jgi:hypothetical protein
MDKATYLTNYTQQEYRCNQQDNSQGPNNPGVFHRNPRSSLPRRTPKRLGRKLPCGGHGTAGRDDGRGMDPALRRTLGMVHPDDTR